MWHSRRKHMNQLCTTKKGFFFAKRRCNALAAGQCVYCGEYFCSGCGVLGSDYQEVCCRPKCLAKYEDLNSHKAWIKKQTLKNKSGLCGSEECESEGLHRCEQCYLDFCSKCLKHARAQVVRIRDTKIVDKIICKHCVDRQKIWLAE